MENDQKDGTEKVTLMTLHGAKGLEFDTSSPRPAGRKGCSRISAMDEGGNAGLEENAAWPMSG